METPPYTVTEFEQRHTRYCFAAIVYNEGVRFIDQLKEMSKRADLADILVAERRSTDGSTDPNFLRSHGVRTLLTTEAPGAAAAIRMAFAYALHEGYDGVVLVDGNGKDGMAALPQFIEKLDAGFDFIQGSRFMRGGYHKNTPLARLIGIRCVMNPLLWLGSGSWNSDACNGFRGYSRRYLEDPRVQPFRECFNHFNIQYYLSMRAPALGLKTTEIPVSRVYPDDGTVPTKVTGFKRNFLGFWEMVLTVAGQYNPKSH